MHFFWYIHGFHPDKASALASWVTVSLLVVTAIYARKTWKETQKQSNIAEGQLAEAKYLTLVAMSEKDDLARPIIRVVMAQNGRPVDQVNSSGFKATIANTFSIYTLKNVGAFAQRIGLYEFSDDVANDRVIPHSENFIGPGHELVGSISVIDERILVVMYHAAGAGGHFFTLARNSRVGGLVIRYVDPRLDEQKAEADRVYKRVCALEKQDLVAWL